MFICFEGIDGAGKSTQARMLVQRLLDSEIPAVLVSDPGTTRIGTAIRQILLNTDEPISAAAQMLLFSAARAELASYIAEKIRYGHVVVCDRWLLSTLVYQGEINNISTELITHIFRETSFLQPDICFLLDILPEAAAIRMGRPGDRYERRCAEDRHRMRSAYLRHAHERPNAKRVYVISADQEAAETHEQVYGFVRLHIRDLNGEQKHGCAARNADSETARKSCIHS
jgi:dTMP kinase